MIATRPRRISIVSAGYVLALSLFIQGCGPDTAAEDYKPLKARAAMSDTAFRDLIVETLNADDALKQQQLQVRVHSRNGEVTLSGRVTSAALRLRAVDLVRSVAPDIVLTDEIVVDARS